MHKYTRSARTGEKKKDSGIDDIRGGTTLGSCVSVTTFGSSVFVVSTPRHVHAEGLIGTQGKNVRMSTVMEFTRRD